MAGRATSAVGSAPVAVVKLASRVNVPPPAWDSSNTVPSPLAPPPDVVPNSRFGGSSTRDEDGLLPLPPENANSVMSAP